MDSTLGAAGLTVLAAVATTLWTSGGRATLERRAMREEMDIARSLTDGSVKDRLNRIAEDRAATYIRRRVGSEHALRYHLKMASAFAVLSLVVVGLGSLTNAGPHWVEIIVDTLFLSMLVLAVTVLAVWLSEAWRDHQADLRHIDIESAVGTAARSRQVRTSVCGSTAAVIATALSASS